MEATTANGVCTLRIKAVALPGAVATALDEHADLIRMTLASTSAQGSTEQSTPELASPRHSTDDDTGAASDTDAVTPTASQQHQPSGVDMAAAKEAEEASDVTISEPGGRDSANGQTSALSHAQQAISTGTSAEALNYTHVGRSQLEPTEAAQGSETDPSNSQQGSPRLKGNKFSIQNGSKDAEQTAPVSNGSIVNQQDQEEEQSTASGKVGLLKQRLLAAAKEAKPDSSALLKVSLYISSPFLSFCRNPSPPLPSMYWV